MNNKRRGIALVINNIEFKENKHTKREGAEFDSENLERVLGRLHFEVHLFTDQTRDEIENLLILASTKDHSDADCFMCVIMSHGTILADGGLGVIGVDGELINIEEGAKSFFSNKNCPTLKNKPRLFFVDACWGQGLMEVTSGINIDDITKASFNSRNSSNSSILTNSYSSVSASNPDISDFLFSFSTLPTYVSLRDRHKGNWFIQEFASALDKLGETRTLSDIMHKVRQKLMQKTTALWAQMSVDHWMLSRQVIFTSKEKKILCSSKSNTYLLGILEKECEDDDLTYEEEQVCIMNEFPLLLLLTQIGKSCKFASVASDSKSVDIWLLLGKKKETLFVLSGHSHHVTALHSFDALHNNSKVSVLASGCEDGSIRIWNVKSGECLQLILGHEKKVVAFESIGMSKLASSSLDGTIRVWDLSFHFVLQKSSIIAEPIRHVQIPKINEQDLAMFVFACGKLIQVYDSTTGAFIRGIKTDNDIEDLIYVGKNRIAIAQGGLKGNIQVRDVKTRLCEKSLPIDYYIEKLYSLGSETLAIVGHNFRLNYFIDILDLNSMSRKLTKSFNWIDASISLLSFRNHKLLIGGFKSGIILIFNVENGECEYLSRKDDKLGDLRILLLLDNGKLVSIFKRDIFIWDVEKGRCVQTFKSERCSDIEQVILGDSEKLAVALKGEMFACATRNTICVWNLNGFEFELIGHTDKITALKCLGNSMLASGSKDKTIRIWQINASCVGECLATLTGHTNSIEALMPFDKSRLASVVFDEKVRVWNCNIRPLSTFFKGIQKKQKDENNSYLFKSIGIDKFAMVHQDKISVWNVISNTSLPDLSYNQEKKSSKIISLLQSHGDSTLIGVVDSTILTWNVITGNLVHILKEHCKPITSLLVVSGRNEFITGAHDGTIRVWDVSTGRGDVLEKDIGDRIFSINLLHNDASMMAIFGLARRTGFLQVKQLRGKQLCTSFRPHDLEIQSIHSYFQ